MGYYSNPDELDRAALSRKRQDERVQKELRRKNKQREQAEAQASAKPLSGYPAKKKKNKQGVSIPSKDYWRNRAFVAEAALKRLANAPKPAAGPSFYESQEWRVLRYKALKLHGRKCQLCSATDAKLHVDHIKPRSKYPELELRLDNLQVLCEDCNLGKGAWDQSDWRKGALQSIPGA